MLARRNPRQHGVLYTRDNPMIGWYNALPKSVQQVILLSFVMAVLVAANMLMANDPSTDDAMRGVVQAVIVRLLALAGVSIERK